MSPDFDNLTVIYFEVTCEIRTMDKQNVRKTFRAFSVKIPRNNKGKRQNFWQAVWNYSTKLFNRPVNNRFGCLESNSFRCNLASFTSIIHLIKQSRQQTTNNMHLL